MKKRILSLLMTITLCCSMPSTVVSAEVADATVQETQGGKDTIVQARDENNETVQAAQGSGDEVVAEDAELAMYDGTISGNSVQMARSAASVIQVAIDGKTTEYSNIFEAFETVNDSSFTSTAVITLLDDVYLPEDEDERFAGFPGKIEFGSRGSVTLDLNGHLLTQTDIGFTDGYTPNVIEMLYGTLTITGKGTIYQRYKTAAISVSSQSTLTIDSDDVTVKADFTYGSKQFPTDSSRAISVDGGTLTVNGGTFEATSGVALEYTAGTARLYGGSFNGIKILTYKYPGKINEGVTVTDLLAAGHTYQHTDGTFPADYYVQTISDVKVVEGLVPVPYVDENGADATVKDYTQVEADTTVWNGGVYVARGNVTINGGVTVSGNMPSIILCDGASLTVNGGITLPDGSAAPLMIYGQSGGTGKMTVTNSSGYAISSAGKASIRLLNGTLTATGSPAAFSHVFCWNQQGGNDEIKCVKTGSESEVWADGMTESSVTISRCTEHQWSYTQKDGEEQHLKTCALCLYNPNGAGTYENCVYDTFSSQGEGGHKKACICGRIENGAALTVHTPSYSANTDGLTHSYRCKDCGFVSGEAEKHSYTDGICSSCNYACPHEGADKTVGSDTEGLCADCGEQVYEARLVRDNGRVVEHYETVEEALAHYTSVSDPIVTLLCDKDMGDGALVVTYEISGKELDLGGHTLSGSGDAVFQINKRYGFTLHNGTVENTGDGDAIQLIHGIDPNWGGMISDGELTVENLTVTAAKGWALHVMDDASYADLNVKSGTFTGGLNMGTVSGGHKVKIYGGVFIANPDTHSVYYPGASLTDTMLIGRLKDMLADGVTYGDADGNAINYFAEENRTIIGKSQYGYPEGVYLNAETVTIVEHTSHTIDWDSGKCSICGAPCAHIQTDDAGLCTACGVRVMFCEAEGTLYKTIQAAQETLKDRTDNPTVKLLADYGDNVSLLGTENGYTLDLNGFRLIKSPVIMLEGRILTIADSSEAKTGGLTELQISGGTAYLRDGIYAELSVSHGTIKITGEGTVKITKKIEMPGKFIASGEYSNDLLVADMLLEGYAFYLVDENTGTETLVNGYWNVNNQRQQYLPGPNRDRLTLKDGQYYTVKPHTHSCADSTVTVCECGLTCDHADVGTDGKCAGCGKVFTAKVTDPDGSTVYYADGVFPDSGNTRSCLDIAFGNASSGSTVTLLGSTAVGYLDGGKELTLALGGKSVNSLYIGRESNGNSLTVTGTGSIGSVFVHADSKIDLTGWSGNMDSLYVYSGGSATLRGGTFGKVILDGNTAGSLLAPGYAFRYEDGSYVSYTATDDLTRTVSVVPCGYEGWYGSDSSAVCPCCDQTGTVQVPVTSADGTAQYAFYVTLQGAVSNTNRSDSKDDLIKLLEDVSGDCTIDRNVFINMNNHNINGALTVNNAEVYFLGQGSTVTAITMSGSKAKFGLISRSSVIPGMGTLTIAGGADWGSILPEQSDRHGYKLFGDDNSYEWRDSDTADADAASMTNVSIGRLPIPSTDLEFRVDGRDIVATEVGTTVQFTATCSTGASVTFYIQKQDSETPVMLTGQGDFGSYSAEYQFSEIGEYTIWFTGTKDGYTAQSVRRTLNITKLEIPKEAITAPVAKTDLVYNGKEQELVTPGSIDTGYGTIVYSDPGSSETVYSTDIPKAKDAGTYKFYYMVQGNGDYADTLYPKLVTVTIEKRELAVEDVAVMAKTYDGTDTAEFGAVTFGNALDDETPNYVVQGVYDDSSAGDGRVIDITVDLRGNSLKNYIFADGAYTAVFRKTGLSIARAGAPTDINPGALTICNALDKTYSLDLSALLPPAPKGIYGTIAYGGLDTTLDTDTFAPGVDSKNGLLTLKVSKRGSSTEGSIGTITVKVRTDNYEDIPLTINVSAINKLVPVPEGAVTASAITYGQMLEESSITGTMKDGDTEVSGTFTWQVPNVILTVGTHKDLAWKFTPSDTQVYDEVTGITTVTVNKAAQNGTVNMENYTYNTTPSTPGLINRTGDENASVTYYYSTTNSTSGGMKWENIQPTTLNAGTYYMYAVISETDNYSAFTSAAGKFTVGKAMPDYTMPTGLTAKYGQKLSEIALTNSSDNLSGTWSWQTPGMVLDQVGSRKYYADFNPNDKNYKEVVNVAIEVIIKPADGGVLKTETLEQKYADTSDHTYTPDWSELPAGQKWTYSSEYSISNGSTATLARQEVAADGRLTYAITDGKAGDVVTITLKAQCANYKDFTITLNITLTGETEGDAAYRIIEGANGSWNKSTDGSGSLEIRGDGAFSKFVNVKVDGIIIDPKNYEVREGSTIITLKPEFLKTLSEGSHTFEIAWTDGTAKTSFTVAMNTSGNNENDKNENDKNENDKNENDKNENGKNENGNNENGNNENGKNEDGKNENGNNENDKNENGNNENGRNENGNNENGNNENGNNENGNNNNGSSNNDADSSDSVTQALTRSPNTGDASGLWITLFTASIAGLAVMLVRRKK